MLTLKLRYFLILSLCSAGLIEPAFSQTRLKIVDQHNDPLPNAVIEYTAKSSSVKSSAEDPIYIMDQIDKQFAPHVLIVPEGSLVSFPNSDDIRHHVYSFSAAKTFELKLYAGKPKSPLRFDKEGVVVMGCNIHDSMVGYIYVAANEHTIMSDEKGEVSLTQDLPLQTQLKIWHPNSSVGLSKHREFTIDQAMLNKPEITLMINIDNPEPRNSFEELNLHEH
ncbi:MAG: methylamine utilization protein [Oleispira antarctica]|nr:methylamine utilization protein [Oleispira antarctica]MBQ0791689.1 methylamine utilization protein [Oleispira antarctica]|tara:strand:- start:3205 stop:3870 length:666 start_codon:yes stop_codon:yes gene_type:complete